MSAVAKGLAAAEGDLSSPTSSPSTAVAPRRSWRAELTQLSLWYLALLVPTIGFKLLYLLGEGGAAKGSRPWIDVALGKESGFLSRATNLFLVLRADLVEIALA